MQEILPFIRNNNFDGFKSKIKQYLNLENDASYDKFMKDVWNHANDKGDLFIEINPRESSGGALDNLLAQGVQQEINTESSSLTRSSTGGSWQMVSRS